MTIGHRLLYAMIIASCLSAMPAGPIVKVIKGRCSDCKVPFGLGRIQFVTEREAWASASYMSPRGNGSGLSTFLRSTDGGRHWHRLPFVWQYSAEDEPPFSFVDSQHGWVASSDWERGTSRLSRTADGGRSWTHRQAGALSQLHFFDLHHGVSVEKTMSESIFHVTADGGETWSSMTLPVSHVDAMSFLDSRTGVISGRWRTGIDTVLRVLLTRDGGAHWTEAVLPRQIVGTARQVQWIDAQAALLPVELDNDLGSTLLQSTDGGWSWTRHTDRSFQGAGKFISALAFSSDRAGYLFYENERNGRRFLATTSDGGATWRTKEIGQGVGDCQLFRKHVLCSSGMNVLELRAP